MPFCRTSSHKISLRTLFRLPSTYYYYISHDIQRVKFSTDAPPAIDTFSADSDSTSTFKPIGVQKRFGAIGDTDQISLNKLLNNVKSALDCGDIVTAWNRYDSMERHSFLDLLGISQLESLSKSMTIRCVELLRLGTIAPQEKKAVEAFSLSFALRGLESGLCAVMANYVRKKETDSALHLYQKYVGRLSQSVAMSESSTTEFEEGEHLVLPSMNLNANHVQSNAMALAIAAHAFRGSWEDAMQTMIERPTRFTLYTMRELRKMLEFDPDLRVRALDYLYDLNVLRLVLSPESLNRHILNLTRDNATSQFRKLYTSLINALNGPRAWLAVSEKRLTPSTPIHLPERAWGWVLTACLILRHELLAQRLWDVLLNIGAPIEIVSWTALLEGYRSTGDLDRVLRCWEAMVANGIEPDSFAYRAKISALFDARKKDLALSAFASYQRAFLRDRQALVVYNTVLHGLLTHSDIARARSVLNEMIHNGPIPDIVTYNSFLRFHGRKGDLKAVANVVQELSTRGPQPDVVTFTTIISTLLKAGKANAVEKLLAIMKSMGVEENVATYSAIIDHQVRERNEDSLRVAWDLLAKMEQLPNAQPNEVTYTTLLAGLHRNPDISTQNLIFMLNDITHRMAQRGVRPNQITYNILLKACLDNPKPIGLKSAMSYYREMQSREIIMSADTWYVLLKGLINRGEWGVAKELVGHMFHKGFEPPWRIRELISQIEASYRVDGRRVVDKYL